MPGGAKLPKGAGRNCEGSGISLPSQFLPALFERGRRTSYKPRKLEKRPIKNEIEKESAVSMTTPAETQLEVQNAQLTNDLLGSFSPILIPFS